MLVKHKGGMKPGLKLEARCVEGGGREGIVSTSSRNYHGYTRLDRRNRFRARAHNPFVRISISKTCIIGTDRVLPDFSLSLPPSFSFS